MSKHPVPEVIEQIESMMAQICELCENNGVTLVAAFSATVEDELYEVGSPIGADFLTAEYIVGCNNSEAVPVHIAAIAAIISNAASEDSYKYN